MSNKIRSLARKYSHWFPKDPRYPLRLFGFEVNEGWYELLKRLLRDLDEIGFEGPILQVKEKFGTLRFYAHTSNFAQDLLIDNSEKISKNICEDCGMKHPNFSWMAGWLGGNKPWGRDKKISYVRSDLSWILTLCNYCYYSHIYAPKRR